MTAHPDPLTAIHENAAFLRRLARHLVADEHAAEDLVQDAQLAALERRASGAWRAWFASVLCNLSSNRRREVARRERRERAAARPERAPPGDEVVATLETQRWLVALVQELDEPYRTTVFLRFYEGLAPREIAARLGENVHTVKTRLQRAIERLRTRMTRRDGGEGWRAALAPLLVRGPEPVPVGTAVSYATVIGGIALNTKWLAGVAAAVVIGFGAWSVTGGAPATVVNVVMGLRRSARDTLPYQLLLLTR